MKSIKFVDILNDLSSYQFLYLRDFKIPSVRHSYKPICVIPSGDEKGNFLLSRWYNCVQKVVSLDTVLYFQD